MVYINSNGESIANSKCKKDLEKFQIYVIDETQHIKKRKCMTQKPKISIGDIITHSHTNINTLPVGLSEPQMHRQRGKKGV